MLASAQQYQEAVQNPKFVFRDSELKLAQPYNNKHGMPSSSAGAFAVVFRLKGANRDYAVRCFTKAAPDQERRYAAISAQLKQSQLPYTVSFDYVKEGILVGGKWYPILKMEWAQGVTLDKFICQNLASPQELQNLSRSWIKMAQDLRNAGIAHGDLQHGNVLVSNGKLRLVDYDGMFVPALRGNLSNEFGHRNYQHPLRNEKHFEAYLDRFSSWVIYLALQGLSSDPSLWMRRIDDESLLLGQRDYKSPTQSALLNMLKGHKDANISKPAGELLNMLGMPLEKLPELRDANPIYAPKVGGLPAWLHAQRVQEANSKCSKCKSDMVPKTHRILKVPYWECSTAPKCNFQRFENEGLQPATPAQPAAPAVQPAPPLIPPPTQASAIIAASTSGQGKTSGSVVPIKSGSKSPSGTTKRRASTTRRPKAKSTVPLGPDECNACGNKMNLILGAMGNSFYVCSNYPACNFTKT